MPACLLDVFDNLFEEAVRFIDNAYLAQKGQLLLDAPILLQDKVELPLSLIADSTRELSITLFLLLRVALVRVSPLQ